MRSRNLLSLLLFMLAALLVTACGDDNSGSGGGGVEVNDPGTFSSSAVAEDEKDTTVVSSLDATGQQAFCDTLAAYSQALITDNKAVLCRFSGVMAGSLVGAAGEGDPTQICEQVESECLNTDLTADMEFECPLEDTTASCDATVGELETCFNDMSGMFLSLFSSAGNTSCANAANAEVDTSFFEDFEGNMPTSCTSLEAKCPALFDDSDTATSSSTDGSTTDGAIP